MRILLKLNHKIDTIENVSVDDKCFPLVAGVHPYPASARSSSPLANESSLWFKTLAIDDVYIDCDRRLIYWVPVINDVDPTGVAMRRSLSTSSTTGDFIPSTAQPLFEDSSLYDFNASLKEMMGKCCEAIRKFTKRSISTDEFHKIVAQILHMYILPNIAFSSQDMYSLSRTRCLIEERLGKAENDIADKADSIDKLQKCLNTLKTNLILKENLDSERYLRTCKKDFLKIFLKTAEKDIENLNLELEAEQSKVNWAKHHKEEADRVRHFQDTRDRLFKEVERLIRVREAIKNVISRKEYTRRKLKKAQIIESCFHNVFIEINRRLEVELQVLNNLGIDKVNICAAREATMCAIMELDNNNRSSDRATKFEPVDFVDYSVGQENAVQKPDVWLTFQERVSRILEDTTTPAFKVHQEGCRRLESLINLALSEYGLTSNGGKHAAKSFNATGHEDMLSQSGTSTNNVTRRNLKVTPEKNDRRSAVLIEEKNGSSAPHIFDAQRANTLRSSRARSHIDTGMRFSRSFDETEKQDKVLSTNDINIAMVEGKKEIDTDGWYIITGHPNDPPSPIKKSFSEEQISISISTEISHEEEQKDGVVELRHHGHSLNRQQNVMTQQLALSTLMKAVESLKLQIQGHFRDVVDSLMQHQSRGVAPFPTEQEIQEQQELLWKSYEQFFCQALLNKLTQVYRLGLSTGAQKAYEKIRKTSLHEILKDDKLLDIFFGQAAASGRAISLPVPVAKSVDQISMAKTLSSLSLDVRQCDIKDLYSLANADSNDMCKRLNLEDMDEGDEAGGATASSSGSSEGGDLPLEDGALSVSSHFSSVNYKSPSSGAEKLDTGKVGQDNSSEGQKSRSSSSSSDPPENWRALTNPGLVEEILDPVLTPFRRQVKKCLDAHCFLDKVRYITKATEDLNRNISRMIGPDFQSACDDIISMLILALSNMSEDVFVGLYVNLRILMDVFPPFLRGTLWDYNLVSLYASFDYLFTLKVCESVVKRYPGSFKVKGIR